MKYFTLILLIYFSFIEIFPTAAIIVNNSNNVEKITKSISRQILTGNKKKMAKW